MTSGHPTKVGSSAAALHRAQGCLLGQLAGDALGSQVEFMRAASIAQRFPAGVREMRDGGYWNTLAGQSTDDSEMALLLARAVVRDGGYSAPVAMREYRRWLASGPFDVGNTIRAALQGRPDAESQANGAMMRAAPLGIFCAGRTSAEAFALAREDAALTHPHRICLETNALYVAAIAEAICSGPAPTALYARVVAWAEELGCTEEVLAWTAEAAGTPPAQYDARSGWVRLAWTNALHQMLHQTSLEEAVVATVGLGGDTDTNAAIAGALLGAVHGLGAVPARWVETVLRCRPEASVPGIQHPRPPEFWAGDALELAFALLAAGSRGARLH